ncbi:MAG: hypothetical protein Q9195_007698 [Heterodermia aff. obscurata]
MPHRIETLLWKAAEKPELLMVGTSAMTYRVGNRVIKIINVNEEYEGITEDNARVTQNEANIFLILRSHPRIAECISVGPAREYIELRRDTQRSCRQVQMQGIRGRLEELGAPDD